MAVISYFGGKSSSAFQELINTKIPKTGIKTYLEPFSGSMGTYMDDDQLNFDVVIYNDKNRHQVNLYKCSSDPEKFLPYLENLKKTLLYTEETDPLKKWDFYKKIYKDYQKNDFLDDMNFEIGDFEKAAIYAFLITSAHNSVYPRGAGFNGYKKDKDRLKLEVLIDKLKKNKYTKKLQSIKEFLNIDFEELITKYDAEDTYLYLDPPYFRPDENGEDDAKRLFWYGADKEGMFGPASHRRLLELLKKTKCRWSLSYYYFPLLEELLPKDKYVWTEKEVFRSSAHGGNNSDLKSEQAKRVELLIMNYNPKNGEKSNPTPIGSNAITNQSNTTFAVSSSSGDSVITVGPDGYCVINKLALLDDITGNKWEIRISNGEIIVEPIELEDKREHKLNKILKK